jgi:hypothetical protein
MLSSVFIIILFIILSSNCFVESKEAKHSKTGPKLRQTLVDTNVTSCGKLCDSGKIDSITPLSPEKDDNNYVLVIRGVCAWSLDLKKPTTVSQYGERHRFKFQTVEATFTLFDNKETSNAYNLTALFISGIIGQILRSEDKDKEAKSIMSGPMPLRYNGLNEKKPFSAAFEWQSDSDSIKNVYVIQNDKYIVLDMNSMKQIEGPNDIVKSFGIDPNKVGGIHAAFGQFANKKIYFFTPEDFYIYEIVRRETNISETNSTIHLQGVLGPKQSTKDDFFMCGGLKPTEGSTGGSSNSNGITSSGGGNTGNNIDISQTTTDRGSSSDHINNSGSTITPAIEGGESNNEVNRVLSSIRFLATISTFFILEILI